MLLLYCGFLVVLFVVLRVLLFAWWFCYCAFGLWILFLVGRLGVILEFVCLMLVGVLVCECGFSLGLDLVGVLVLWVWLWLLVVCVLVGCGGLSLLCCGFDLVCALFPFACGGCLLFVWFVVFIWLVVVFGAVFS